MKSKCNPSLTTGDMISCYIGLKYILFKKFPIFILTFHTNGSTIPLHSTQPDKLIDTKYKVTRMQGKKRESRASVEAIKQYSPRILQMHLLQDVQRKFQIQAKKFM